jgi:hypothetical protein
VFVFVSRLYELCSQKYSTSCVQYTCMWIYIYKLICSCVCPVYMSKTGTWAFPVCGNKIWDFLSLTCICHNGPASVKFCHLSFTPILLFGLSNKLILFVFHYQRPCMSIKVDMFVKVVAELWAALISRVLKPKTCSLGFKLPIDV